jgi:hypothetical protein
MAIAFTPLDGVFGFVHFPAAIVAAVAGTVLVYLLAAEFAKSGATRPASSGRRL